MLWDGARKPFITPMRECNSIKLRTTDVVVDIGAYVGTYAIRCARFPVRRVVAYEPTPFTFGVLNLTKLRNLETVQAAVVGDDRKRVNLFVSKGIGVTNSTVLSKGKACKVDVEGAEYSYPVVQPGIRAIIMDFHPVTGTIWQMKVERILKEIKRAGFRTVVESDLSNGWTRAGSWVREVSDQPSDECEELMNGSFCCGCGIAVEASRKALCGAWWEEGSKKHRDGFIRTA